MDSSLTNAYRIKIQNFEGPFDLLFHLIEINQLDIYDIPINDITGQYLDYLFAMQQMDMDIASEFLLMAATLLHIKSRMLLPENNASEEKETDPREELILRLVEYKKYKEYSAKLKNMEDEWTKARYRLPETMVFEREIELLELSTGTLLSVYAGILQGNLDKMDKNPGLIKQLLQREKVSLRSKIKQIISHLRRKGGFTFSDLFSLKKDSKTEVLTGFLAILELARMNKLTLKQKKQFSEIKVDPLKKNSNSSEIVMEESYGDQ